MTLTRRVAVALVATVLLGVPIIAGVVRTPIVVAAAVRQNNSSQTASELRFEVASIKSTKPNIGAPVYTMQRLLPSGGFEAVNVTLGSLIRLAYGLQDFQMVGGPEWLNTERFDVQARAPEGAAQSEARRRLKPLLAERFGLKVHSETRDHPIYALVHARADRSLGPQMRRSKIDVEKARERLAAALRENPGKFPPPPECGLTSGRTLGFCGITMTQLLEFLPVYAGRMVVDRTGLTGAFDLELRFDSRPIPGTGPGGLFPSLDEPANPNALSIFTALEEQLGLKLDAQSGPVEVLVIDHVDQPKPN
jgi:uncharacterized protein (TIGR03435 family)